MVQKWDETNAILYGRPARKPEPPATLEEPESPVDEKPKRKLSSTEGKKGGKRLIAATTKGEVIHQERFLWRVYWYVPEVLEALDADVFPLYRPVHEYLKETVPTRQDRPEKLLEWADRSVAAFIPESARFWEGMGLDERPIPQESEALLSALWEWAKRFNLLRIRNTEPPMPAKWVPKHTAWGAGDTLAPIFVADRLLCRDY